MADIKTRVFGKLRQTTITKGDPLHFERTIEHRGPTLGFYHLYTPESDRRTTQWLQSSVYVEEARKHHPIDLCHTAISQFHEHLITGAEPARAAFLASVRALYERGQAVTLKGHDCFLIPHFDQIEGYRRHHKPWVASMVQGWAAALFLRAYQLDGDPRLVEAARRTCGVFFVEVQDGGILSRLPHGQPFYEKYPFPGQTRHVLNGFMSSLFGLHDLARAADDQAARSLFEAGVETLLDRRTIAAFDNGYSTLYDLGGDRRATPSGVFYTWVHARQLAGLARITGARELMTRAQRWRDYVFKKRYTVRSTADCMYFRARRLPLYLGRYLHPEPDEI